MDVQFRGIVDGLWGTPKLFAKCHVANTFQRILNIEQDVVETPMLAEVEGVVAGLVLEN